MNETLIACICVTIPFVRVLLNFKESHPKFLSIKNRLLIIVCSEIFFRSVINLVKEKQTACRTVSLI